MAIPIKQKDISRTAEGLARCPPERAGQLQRGDAQERGADKSHQPAS